MAGARGDGVGDLVKRLVALRLPKAPAAKLKECNAVILSFEGHAFVYI